MNQNYISFLVLASVFLPIFIISFYHDIYLKRLCRFPYLSFFILYYSFFYLINPFLINFLRQPQIESYRIDRPFPIDIEIETAVFVGFFVLAHTLGYLGGHGIFRWRRQPTNPSFGQERSLTYLIVAFAAIALFALIKFAGGEGIPGVANLAMPSWYFGVAILSILAMTQPLRWPVNVAIALIGIAFAFISISNGFLTPIIFSISIIMCAAIYTRRFKVLVVAGVLVLFCLPTYGFVKDIGMILANQNPRDEIPEMTDSRLVRSIRDVARRSTHIQFLQHVVDQAPSQNRFSDDRPILRAFLNHLPRIVWPDKPREVLGNSFGKEFGIINVDDNQTSWNIPWTVDFYRVGGFPMMPVYGAVTGLMIGVLAGFMSTRRETTIWFGIYAASIFPLFYQESNFSLMAGSVFWVISILYAGFSLTRISVKVLGRAA